MIRSMTAFARRELRADWGTARWELRSVNNRFLDVSPRLPEDLRAMEAAVRERVAARLKRGKADCTLRLERVPGGEQGLSLNLDVARQIAAAASEIATCIESPAPVNPLDVLRWPGVLRTELADPDAVANAALALLDEALAELVEAREREGAKITAMLEQRLTEVTRITAEVRAALPEILAGVRERINERLVEMQATLDPDRLEQEMVLLAQKTDIAEEIDRIDAHVAEIRHVMQAMQPVGRRLDFLIQELHREANTLGSKSIDTRTTRASVDLKVLIEQLREQVQNVE